MCHTKMQTTFCESPFEMHIRSEREAGCGHFDTLCNFRSIPLNLMI